LALAAGFADFWVLAATFSGTALRTADFAADLGPTGAFFFCAILFLTLAYWAAPGADAPSDRLRGGHRVVDR